MKEIGEYLKQERRKNGVSISEACEDLNLNQQLIEAIEEGNSKAFRDVFELKEAIQSYAKYLGLNVDEVLDRFNDFIFEKTSRISLEDIKNSKKFKNREIAQEFRLNFEKILAEVQELRCEAAWRSVHGA